ncbi:MAG: hypothetical protein PVH67_01930 [Desulfobacterales bacterium]|jgi:hypothetical protein
MNSLDKDEDEDTIERVKEVYVAVFPVPFSEHRKAEVILAGFKSDPTRPNMSQVRATVETNVNAVQDLVALCDEIVNEQEEIESYRLLKFDQDGIHILCPADFRAFEYKFTNIQWGSC